MSMEVNRQKIADNDDVQKMISDVSDVLSKHLISIIGKSQGDKEKMEKYFMSIPFVKEMYDENTDLKMQLRKKEEKIDFLNKNMSSLSQKYTELFFRNNKIKISASLNNDMTLGKTSTDICENPTKNNIELEVKDTVCDEKKEIDAKTIEQDVEDTLQEKRKEMFGFAPTEINNLDDLETDLNRFSSLNDDESSLEDESNEEPNDEPDVEPEEEPDVEPEEEPHDEPDDEPDVEPEEEPGDEPDDEPVENPEESQENEDTEEYTNDDVEEVDEAEVEEAGDEEEEVEEAGDEEEEVEEAVDEEDDEEEEVVEVEIEGVKYFASELGVGDIYEYLEDDGEGDIGEVVGHYVNKEPIIF